MKKRVFSLLLCIALLAAVLPAGMPSAFTAAEENELYKTENVTVPEGWDYVEVSTREELMDAAKKHGGWDTDGQPVFIRLMNDISVSNSSVGMEYSALIHINVWSTTVLDLNGHTIKGEISAEKNGDNHTWNTLLVILDYGLVPDLYFRIVDSVGGRRYPECAHRRGRAHQRPAAAGVSAV